MDRAGVDIDGDPAALSHYSAMDSDEHRLNSAVWADTYRTPKPAKSTRPTETSPTITSARSGGLALRVRGNHSGVRR
ncbi:hypothetical protein C9J85_03125 [Haloferax sp. wsp5]|nr:hypothetical protein C9J85_03125 [Haloferax sp. wsp5]